MAVTFIHVSTPRMTNDKTRKKLDISRARSHSARVIHARARKARNAAVAPRRTYGWHFGHLGCATDSDIDSRLIEMFHSCIIRTPETIMNGQIIHSPSLATLVAQMTFPVAKEMYQLSVSHKDLMASTLPTSVALVIDNPHDRQPYQAAVAQARRQATASVREALHTDQKQIPAHIKMAVLNLCLEAIASGNEDVAELHLRGLLALRPALDLDNSLDSLIWHMARTSAIGHAIRTLHIPLYELEANINVSRWALDFDSTSSSPKSTDSETSPPSHMPAGSSAPSGELSRLASNKLKSLVSGWRRAQLVSKTAEQWAAMYDFATGLSSDGRPKPIEDAADLLATYNQRLAGLHQLCTIAAGHVDVRKVTGLFDVPLIIALQIRLVLDLGGLLAVTLGTLQHRLCECLRLVLFEDSDQATAVDGRQHSRRELEAWLLLTGSSASSPLGSQDVDKWFRYQALKNELIYSLGSSEHTGMRESSLIHSTQLAATYQ
jgi:hypothetical protein